MTHADLSLIHAQIAAALGWPDAVCGWCIYPGRDETTWVFGENRPDGRHRALTLPERCAPRDVSRRLLAHLTASPNR